MFQVESDQIFVNTSPKLILLDEQFLHPLSSNNSFSESFNVWRLLLMIVLCYQTKIIIDFWYRKILNPRPFIQSSESLSVELTGTYNLIEIIY